MSSSVLSGLKLEAKPRVFTPDNTRAASFLNVFKNIPSKAFPFGIKTIALLCKEEISIQKKTKTSELQKQYGSFKSMLFLFGLHSSLSRVEEGWLKNAA